jgi:hypothetical protein
MLQLANNAGFVKNHLYINGNIFIELLVSKSFKGNLRSLEVLNQITNIPYQSMGLMNALHLKLYRF